MTLKKEFDYLLEKAELLGKLKGISELYKDEQFYREPLEAIEKHLELKAQALRNYTKENIQTGDKK